jgi:cysteine desulfurase family protein
MERMIYLNNAATTFPKPPAVVEAVNAYNQSPPIQPGRSGSTEDGADIVRTCRKNLCRLFNITSPADIIFTSSATHSLNLVLKGLLRTGDHVVTTMVEHNSVLRVLKTLEKTHALKLSIVGCDQHGHVNPADIHNHITSRTKAIIVNHCSNVTGRIQDIASIGKIARSNSVYFIVDGAQSGGSIEVDLQQVPVDAFIFAGHKSLFGMQGTGGLYLRNDLHPEPLIVGGTGVKSDYLYQPPGRPTFYEAGTPNMPGIVSLNAGVAYVRNEGIASIRTKKAALKNMALEGLLGNRSVIVYGGGELSDFQSNDAVISFNIKDMPPDDTGYILNHSFGIVCRSGLHCAPLIHQPIGSSPNGCVRISFSCFNERKDVEVLINAVDDITGTLRTK